MEAMRAKDDAQQRGLAATTRPDERKELSARDLYFHFMQHPLRAKPVAYLLTMEREIHGLIPTRVVPRTQFPLLFFSSRRRHTRSLCDWSSDVCSSDLARARRPSDGLVRFPAEGLLGLVRELAGRFGPTGKRVGILAGLEDQLIERALFA